MGGEGEGKREDGAVEQSVADDERKRSRTEAREHTARVSERASQQGGGVEAGNYGLVCKNVTIGSSRSNVKKHTGNGRV